MPSPKQAVAPIAVAVEPIVPPPPNVPLFTCSQIAARVAQSRGTCHRTNVWRAINRLKIQPALTVANFNFYTEADADRILSQMRHRNKA